jgi:microcystin-dependent protein
MPSTFSTSLRLELIGDGEQAGVWGNTTNNNMGDLIEQAIAGRTTLNVTSGDITLTSLNGVVDQARSAVLAVTGTPVDTRVLTIPNVQKSYTVINQTTNIVQVKTLSGTAFDCPPLSQSYISCDALNNIVGRSITDGANTITSLAAPFASPAFTGVPTAPTASSGTNTTQLATTAFANDAASAAAALAIPVGLITMWSGSIASIPSGWALCDGTSGTPNLRDRFVVGAGTTYAVGDTGGANTVTLDTTQIPSHTHTGTTANTDLAHTHTGSGTSGSTDLAHTHTGSGTTTNANIDHTHSGTTGDAGTHQHTFPLGELAGPYFGFATNGDNDTFGRFATTDSAGSHAHSFTTSGMNSNVNHTHTYSFTTAGASTPMAHAHSFSFTSDGASVEMNHNHTFTSNATGGGLAHENRPPYYALAYIMRVA